MSETSTTTKNGHEIKQSVDLLEARSYRDLLASKFGISGESPRERVEQLKDLSQEGVAILLEKINALAQGSGESLMNHEEMTRIGGKDTIAPEHRYEVFTNLIESIKSSPREISPARLGDTLAMGVVLLHPFHDGNGRTARLVGMIFHDEFDSSDYEDNFTQLIESRDEVRKRGGFMLYGYTPKFPEGFDQSDPSAVSEYLSKLLQDESTRYLGPFGEAALYDTKTSASPETYMGDVEDELIENYEPFHEEIEKLRENKGDSVLVGAGTHSDVYRISKNGKEYAVRAVRQMDKRVEIMHSHIAAGARARGLKGLEQIIAASYEEGMIVSEFVAGSHLQELTVEQLAAIPDAHFDALVSARLAAMERGVVFDDHPPNTLYDSDQGFTDIDYHLVTSTNKKVDIVEAAKTVVRSLDLTEQHLYEPDSDKRELYDEKKMYLRERINHYMIERFNEDDYKEIRAAFIYSIAWRQASAPQIK